MTGEQDPLTYTRKSILTVLSHLNTVVVSIDRIGSATAGKPRSVQAETLRRFCDDFSVFRRLSECRSILADAFSDELGNDDMDDLEREMQDLEYWKDE